MLENESFGLYLRKIRKLSKLSLNELENRSGVSSALLSRIENGKRNPSYKSICKIAPHLNVSSAELLAKAGLLSDNPVLIIDNDKTKELIINLTEAKKELLMALDPLSEETIRLIVKVIKSIMSTKS